jgi:hypothetical protein
MVCGREDGNKKHSIYAHEPAQDCLAAVRKPDPNTTQTKPRSTTLANFAKDSERIFGQDYRRTDRYANIERENKRAEALKALLK